MRIVITGASGNLGTALLRQLSLSEATDGLELVGICRRRPPQLPPYDRASWVETDLSEPGSEQVLTRAFEGADAVVHLAWLIQPSYNRQLLWQTNQGGTERVVRAAQRAGVGQLVHASSVGVYSPRRHRSPVNEDWPREGVASSSYSVDKAAAEHLLDRLEAESSMIVTRMRPGLIMQGAAASEISRYFLPRWLPPTLVRPAALRFLPLPVEFSLQFVHANDVARAFVTVLEARASGAFNVVTDPVIDRQAWQRCFGGVAPAVTPALLRQLASLSWRAHLQPVDPGWIDLAANVPVLSSARIRAVGWRPAHFADEVLLEFVRGLSHRSGTGSPALQPR